MHGLISHPVHRVALGGVTRYENGLLTVDERGAQVAFRDAALASVRVTWASPGDSVRIIKVLDAVEPRTKGPGPDGGGIFPGFVGPARPQSGGAPAHVLTGVALITAGYLPRAQEGLIDMSGPGADLSPFGSTHNLVIEFTPAAGASWEAVDVALRTGLLTLANRIAQSALGPSRSDHPPVRPSAASLPRIGAITNLQTQGTFKDVFVYGKSFARERPLPIDAHELFAGAVVSGQYGHPALKNPTYVHQNNPVATELLKRDGKDLTFVGVIISPEPVDQAAKEQISAQAAQLCADLKMDGVVLTKEGGGNADADVALKMDALDTLGIASVGLFAEMGGPDGTAPPLVVPPDRATGMVSTGNYDELVTLSAMERALGGETVDVLSAPATAPLTAPTAVIYCSLSPMGAGRLTCREVVQ